MKGTVAAITTIEKNKKLSKTFKIEPAPKYIRDVIISRRQRYLKAHPKKKRKLEAKINIEKFNEQTSLLNKNLNNSIDNINGTYDPVELEKKLEEEISDEEVDISKDDKIVEQNQQLNKLSEEEVSIQNNISSNKEKIQELEKNIETGKNKEIELNKKHQEIFQKIEELKSRKRKMFEMMKK